jgi:hypothetical protein
MQRSLSTAVVAAAAAAATACRLGPHARLTSRRWRSDTYLSIPTPHPSSPYHTRPTTRQQRRPTSESSSTSSPVGRGPVKDRLPPVPTDLADPRRRLAVLVDGTNPNLIPGECTTLAHIRRASPLFSTVLPAVLQVGVPVLLRVFAHQLPSAWEPLIAGSHNTSAYRVDGDAGNDLQGRRESSSAATAVDDADADAMKAAPLQGSSSPSLIPLPGPSSSSSSSSPVSSSSSSSAMQPCMQVEFFRVERFIPVAMQIEADARHLYELRSLNKIEGVCYVCHEVDRAMYVSLMQEQRSGSAALAGLLHQSDSSSSSSRSPGSNSVGTAAFFNQYVLDEFGMADEMVIDGRSKDGS